MGICTVLLLRHSQDDIEDSIFSVNLRIRQRVLRNAYDMLDGSVRDDLDITEYNSRKK